MSMKEGRGCEQRCAIVAILYLHTSACQMSPVWSMQYVKQPWGRLRCYIPNKLWTPLPERSSRAHLELSGFANPPHMLFL